MKKDVKINGKIETISQSMTILEFLKIKNLNPLFVVVECDGKIVPKNEFNNTKMVGSKYEIIEFVGGG